MTSTKHRPGPWVADEHDVYARDWRVVRCDYTDEGAANAALIAAAPDLLACCEWALRMMNGGRPEEDLVDLRAAITKARGGTA